MTNTSLRKRFGIAEKNYSIASRIIADAVEDKLIRPFDPESASKEYAKYRSLLGVKSDRDNLYVI